MSNVPRSKITSGAAYQTARLVADNLLGRVDDLLQAMPAPPANSSDDHPIHWGRARDVTQANALLLQVIAHLTRASLDDSSDSQSPTPPGNPPANP
jgi:hypothetical protein